MRSMNRTTKIIVIALLFVGIMVSLVMCQKNRRTMPELSYPNATWTQLDEPKEGQEIAVVDTTEGEFRIALYRDNAPATVENFVKLANSGFYDGKYVYQVEADSFMMFGTAKKNGSIVSKDEVIKEGETSEKRKYTQETYDIENKKNKNEINDKMWPFKGAVMSLGPNYEGTGAFICIIDSVKLTDANKKELYKGDNINKDLVDKLIEVGGIPQFSQKYTFFGQTYKGMDVVEKIMSMEREKKAAYPKEDVKINSVKIEKYAK